MLKKLHVLLLVLLAAVCFTATAWADYDYIEQYGVMVTPNTEDGSLLITVKLEWTPLEELPYGQELKIGVPNGSIRDVAALTDNIERLDFDNSYMYVYLDRAYEANETFSFAYSWVQEYMYQLSTNGVIEDYDNVHYDYVTYDYTAGWFDEARIGQMTLIWNDPAGLTGDFTEGTVSGADSVTVQDHHRLRSGLRLQNEHTGALHRLAHPAGGGIQCRQSPLRLRPLCVCAMRAF